VIHSVVDVEKKIATSLISSLLEDKNQDDLFKVVEDLNERQLSKKFRRTLCHGNLIRENIMFKCDQKVPSESRLINFRSKQYSPPMCDVLQVIFFNTNEDFRQHYFYSLLAHYHECLKDELEKYCLDIDHILLFEDLKLGVHNVLPLVKLQAALHQQNCQKDMTLRELKELLNCPLLSKEDCFTIVQNKFQTTNYEFLSFKVTPLDEVNGFLGDYYKLQIKIRRQKEEIINCFIKCMPKGTASKQVVQDGSSFIKETFLYETLVQKFRHYRLVLAGLLFPKTGRSVFEDMSLLNYRSLSALKPFDLEMLSMLVRKLAKFHGSAFVYEERVSERLGRSYRLNEEYGRYFKESIILESDTHSGARLIAPGVRGVFDATSLYPELQTETNQENLKKHRSKLTELFYSVITASDRFRNVLSHGDLWSSNILVQLDEDKPLDCRFIDFQLLKYCPPSHDLLSLLHLATDRTTTLQHEETIKHLHYDKLSQVLKSHNCDISKIYPYDELVGAIDYMRVEMVLQAAMYTMFNMCTPEDIASLLTDGCGTCNRFFFEDRIDFLARMCQKSHIYKTRLGERLLDVYEYCNSMS
jgi:aminoglycoside/choline kinase family phosphotransferase